MVSLKARTNIKSKGGGGGEPRIFLRFAPICFLYAASWLDAKHLQSKSKSLMKYTSRVPSPSKRQSCNLGTTLSQCSYVASKIGSGWEPSSFECRQGKHRSACTDPRRHVLRKQCWEDSSVFKRKKTPNPHFGKITWEVADLTALTFVSSPPTCTTGFASAGGEPGKR